MASNTHHEALTDYTVAAKKALAELEPTRKMTMRGDAVGARRWAEEEIEEYLEHGTTAHLETARDVLDNHTEGAAGDARDHFEAAIEELDEVLD